MSDALRTRLERAASAIGLAGYAWRCDDEHEPGLYCWLSQGTHVDGGTLDLWNPEEYSAAAFEVATTLELSTRFVDSAACASNEVLGVEARVLYCGPEAKAEAMRRAITQAAAQYGNRHSSEMQ